MLTVYSAHPVALSCEAYYAQPYLWNVIHLVLAALFAVVRERGPGQGPLERAIGLSVDDARRLVLKGTLETSPQ